MAFSRDVIKLKVSGYATLICPDSCRKIPHVL